MPCQLLLDSDVLIDYLRRDSQAISYIEQHVEDIAISVVTVAELYSGVREGRERTELELFLSALEILPIDRDIAVQAGLFRRQYRKSHRLGLPDVLIAATSHQLSLTLVTLNQKHYPMIQGVIVPYWKS